MKKEELAHFEAKEPEVRQIYEALLKGMRGFGKVAIEPKKTSIHLVNKFAFAGIYTRRNYMNLEMPLSRSLSSPRVTKVARASANRFHYTIRLVSADEVDKELLSWLLEAYQLKS